MWRLLAQCFMLKKSFMILAAILWLAPPPALLVKLSAPLFRPALIILPQKAMANTATLAGLAGAALAAGFCTGLAAAFATAFSAALLTGLGAATAFLARVAGAAGFAAGFSAAFGGTATGAGAVLSCFGSSYLRLVRLYANEDARQAWKARR